MECFTVAGSDEVKMKEQLEIVEIGDQDVETGNITQQQGVHTTM